MIVEVLISAMNQTNFELVNKCHIKSSCLIINQCDAEKYEELSFEYGKIRMISTKERGLSKSRNMALANSEGDILVLCDDDIQYIEGYQIIIKNAFKELPLADVIVFNINSVNPEIRPQEKYFIKKARIPKHKTYSSVHIAFRKKSIESKGIIFDERFGTGSKMFSMGEDSLFFTQIHKAGLKAYVYPAIIANLSSDNSTWFKGYNRKYFYDVGAFLSAAYPKMKYLLKYYYPIRFVKLSKLSFREIIDCINHGFKGYKDGIAFQEWQKE